MNRRGKRKRIARGIYEDRIGRAAVFRDGSGRQRELRFPPSTPIQIIRDAVDEAKQQHRGSGSAKAARGTLNAAIDTWANLERHLASWRERRAELRAWGTLCGTRRLHAIRDHDVRRAMSQWAESGVSPKTIRNRLWSLKHLYHVILGPHVQTPADYVEPPPTVRTIPTPVDPRDVLSVYANLLEMERRGVLRDAKTRARFMLRACTGKRPSEIMRAQPSDVDLKRREWRVRDGKGGWSEGLYLNDEMLEAWRVFAEAEAWGPFNTGSMAKVLRSAGWQKGLRPYELRHSTGIALSDAGVDLSDISGFLGHRDIRTTRRTYVPIRQARMQRASELLDGRFSGWALPASFPTSRVEPRGKVLTLRDRPRKRKASKTA